MLVAAVDRYRAYVNRELTELAAGTNAFATAVEAGDAGRARRLYPVARISYERIEPVAEVFGPLDVTIDGRADAFTSESDFVGFHRLEQRLWGGARLPSPSASGTSADPATLARQLLAHVQQLQQLVRSYPYTPLQLTSGATELLGEITATKLTGEEERYSHLDLVDIEGNLQGSAAAIGVFTGFLRAHAPRLMAEVRERQRLAAASLARLRERPGDDASGYPSYATVPTAQRRRLAAAVVALQQSVSLTTSVIGE